MRGAVSLLCACAALAPAAARAECARGAADVSWVRLEGAEERCPSAPRLRDEIARRLGRELATTGGGLSIEAVVKGNPGAWSAQIRTVGCDGTPPTVRKLESSAATCEAITSAATLVIALAIDPTAALAAPASPPLAGASPPPEPPEAPPPGAPRPEPPRGAPAEPATQVESSRAAPPPLPDAEREPRPGASVTLRGLATTGLLPVIGPGVAWAAEWSVAPRWTTASGLLWLPEQRTAEPALAFGLTAGWLGVCAEALRTGQLSLGACVHLLAGAVHAVIHEHPSVLPVDPGARLWVSPGVGTRLAVRVVGPLRLETGIDLNFPLTRYRFQLQGNEQPVFEQPVIAGALFGGAGIAF
ncbi:hypothetical protein WMF39_18120 [Sorangium sp. So ce1504]|uniref:hypothetical protein n=1 Tax=Sorangium sp. So ce1504 TaxID=3133337 RepID=UPI003F6186C3